MEEAQNIGDLEALAREGLSEAEYGYAAGGADDERTVAANCTAFDAWQLRCRRLVDVSATDTQLELLGERLAHPILLAPVGFQQVFHPEAELAAARGAARAQARLVASTVSCFPVEEVVAAGGQPVWFQLYPTTQRELTAGLLARAEDAGCPVVMLTVDAPVFGNRERHGDLLEKMAGGAARMGNFEGLGEPASVVDPSMTWDMIEWLRSKTSMRVVIKGVVTAEDALRCVEGGAEGLVVSNHGGRQEESSRGTLESLPEVVEAVAGRLPVLFDGGIRRGTDAFKALALGADAVCVGRPFVWGLAVAGEAGVARAIEMLRAELVRTMQLAGTPSLAEVGPASVVRQG